MLGTKLLVFLVVALTLVAALACAEDVGEPAEPAAVPAAPTAAAAAAPSAPAGGFVVDASDFLKEFEENAIAATGKYKG